MARAGADDVTAVGPADLVLPAVEEFARQVEEHCLLHWEKTKSEVFTWNGDLPPYMQKAGDSWDISPQFFLDFPQNFRLRTRNQYCTQAIA